MGGCLKFYGRAKGAFIFATMIANKELAMPGLPCAIPVSQRHHCRGIEADRCVIFALGQSENQFSEITDSAGSK
jgi:hypothetical protein